ncbi:GD21515 [Drosophila simulans]|uniref:GD21515 n=1 Tax=Drosophila simulans TaxID=7240 RepID=B4NV73_DROSI|nr:GD21515 [Drosophila simulans]
MEGRQRLEQRLDDTVRELAAQRRHFKEEEEKFRESINELVAKQEEKIKKLRSSEAELKN